MKTIVITGGSQGIGKALAESLSTNNKVIVLSNENKTEELNYDYFNCDVRDYNKIEEVIKLIENKYGYIDVLVNNAGLWIQDDLDTNDSEKIKDVIEVNLLGTIYMTKAVIPNMKLNKKGLILNINSQNGFNFKEGRSVYNSSKWGVTGFTKCMQDELSKHGIKVTDVCPGMVSTNLFSNASVVRDETYALEVEEVVRLINFVIDSSDNVHIPEIGIKHILS